MVKCPECGSVQTLKIKLMCWDGVIAIPESQCKKLLPKHSKIYACACTSCGKIFNINLENPEKLAPFADGCING